MPRRWWQGPLLPMAAVVAVGLFVGFPLDSLLGGHGWLVPGDVWYSFEGGRYLAWGDFAGGLTYVSTPGRSVLFAPPAWVATRADLVAAFPFPLARPSAWLVIDPYLLAVSTCIVPAVDRLAARLGVAGRRRTGLLWATALFSAPVTVLWGHTEDVVAVALVMVALVAGLDGRWARVGWLFGAAFVFQPLVALLLPPVLALATPRIWWRVLWRVPVLTALVMAVPLATDGGDADKFLQEPSYIHQNYPTPFLWLSATHGDVVVTAPERLAALAVAVAVGWWAWRRGATPVQVAWCCAAAMAARFLLEPVPSPYYLWPAVAFLLVVMAARRTWWALAPATAASVYCYFHREPWLYWLPLVAMVGLALAAAHRAAFTVGGRSPEPGPAPGDDPDPDLAAEPVPGPDPAPAGTAMFAQK